MVRPEKREAVEALKSRFAAAKGIVLADFTGLTVGEADELRRTCREADVEYKVIKNTLARIAVKEAKIEELEEYFDGPIAVAMSNVDSTAPARVLAVFMRSVKKMAFKGGYLEGRVFSSEEIRAVATLPSREGLLAQVISAVQAPAAQIVWSIEGVLRNLVSILDQASKQASGSC